MGDVVFDERGEDLDHRATLRDGLGAVVDALVVEGAQRGQCVGVSFVHADQPGGGDPLDERGDHRRELGTSIGAEHVDDRSGQILQRDDPDAHGIFEVVGAVGDPIGPTHDCTLGSGRCGSGPRMVADAVEGLGAQVEWNEHDIGPAHRVVVAALDERVEGVLGGVTARAVAAVVAEGDGLGEFDVEADRACHGGGDLRDLEGVGEAGALVIVGEDEDLGLAGEPSEGGGVQDAVAIALEAGPDGIGGFGHGTESGPPGACGADGKCEFGSLLTLGA